MDIDLQLAAEDVEALIVVLDMAQKGKVARDNPDTDMAWFLIEEMLQEKLNESGYYDR